MLLKKMYFLLLNPVSSHPAGGWEQMGQTKSGKSPSSFVTTLNWKRKEEKQITFLPPHLPVFQAGCTQNSYL